MYREDWKGAVESLKNETQVYMIRSFADPVKFYNSEIEIKDISSKIEGENVWVIPYGEVIHGIDHVSILKNSGYRLEEQKDFREITLEKWQRI